MSLATFLLQAGKSSDCNKVVDSELDALFHSQPTKTRDRPTNEHSRTTEKKKKRRVDLGTDQPNHKRPKLSLVASDAPPFSLPAKSRVRFCLDEALEHGPVSTGPSKNSATDAAPDESEPENDDDRDHSSALAHKTLAKDKSKKVARTKTSHAPADETKEVRDARTIFIGNLSPDIVVKRPLKKQLHRHILAHVPTAKIESMRFRSVAFQTPTSKLPEANDEGKKNKHPRQHERDRASSWRDAQTADQSKANEKKFLTPNQKKKIAFIHGNIHSDASAVHAYVVFAFPTPHARPANLPPLLPTMDPFEAARLAVEKCNGTIFSDRMLRVDAIVKLLTAEGPTDTTLPNSYIGDPKLTVFVGNLDFTSKEEDLRVFFEGIVSAERGPPGIGGSQEVDKPEQWVTRVRMVRDKDTQLGKGFAYVQFSDRTCIDEILALEPGRLRFSKRQLRVQRCKSIPSTPMVKRDNVHPPTKPAKASGRTVVPPVPKGDASLGEKLGDLSKEERKRVKAADANRVARRMAKKKARLVLAKQGVPLENKHKHRERARKTGVAKRSGGASPKKPSKGRVRSDNSIAKRNAKK